MDVIRDLRADAYIRPNEGRRKVYLFLDCALLTDQDQNVLLKIVEEGPPYAAFLFCAENSAAVLGTLRSRCVELKLRPAPQEGGGEQPGRRRRCAGVLAGDAAARFQSLWCAWKRKRSSREELSALRNAAGRCARRRCCCRMGVSRTPRTREIAAFLAKNLTKTQMMRTIELLQKYHGECVYNVGPSHVLGALAVELEGIL